MLKKAAYAFALLFLLAWGVFWVKTGPRDPGAYPDKRDSPYLLPWPGDVPRFCIQGNRAVVSHRGGGEYAWDFTMPVGSPVCAARAGEVTRVIIEHNEHGPTKPNNLVEIRHEDGSAAQYLHLKQNGAKVNVGDRVEQGDIIAESGHVGRSSMPHLHFQVVVAPDDHKTIPVTFADVHGDDGIPRMFKTYVSGNRVFP